MAPQDVVLSAVILTVLAFAAPSLGQLNNNQKEFYIRGVVDNVTATHPDVRQVAVSIFNQQPMNRHYEFRDDLGRMVQSPERNTRDFYCVGGITRGLTAVLLQKLLPETNYTWDTPIAEILGHQVILPDLMRSELVNLKDIFSMRTGLAGLDIVPVAGPYDRNHLLRKLRYLPVVAPFRDRFVYNEVLFTLVDRVIEKITDQPVEEAMKERLIKPLFGSAADFFWNATLNRELPYSSVVVSASSLCMSQYGMGSLLRFLTTKGFGRSTMRYLEEEDFDQLFMGVQPRGSGSPYYNGYSLPGSNLNTRDMNALGGIVGRYGAYRVISLDGSFAYHDQSLLTFLPDNGIAVFVSFQGYGGEKDFAYKYLLSNQLLRLEMTDYRRSMSREKLEMEFSKMINFPAREADDRPMCRFGDDCGVQRPLDEFEGVFKSYAFGDVKVKFNESGDEELTLEYGLAKYSLEASRIFNDTFTMKSIGSYYYPAFTSLFRAPLEVWFKAAENDPENRIFTVTIPLFDRNVDAQFSRNPREPSYERREEEGEAEDDCACSACSTAMSVWCVVAFILAAFWKL